jgi:hypothetical protein
MEDNVALARVSLWPEVDKENAGTASALDAKQTKRIMGRLEGG